MHPAIVARMVETIDDISGGRCGLNIVTGWNKTEYAQMGLWQGNAYYHRRYDYAAEYVQILQALWREGVATHHGEFFQLDDCRCLPRPQREITIVCAGQSPRGIEFTAKYGHYNFVMGTTDKLRSITNGTEQHAQKLQRKDDTLALVTLIATPSDEAARSTRGTDCCRCRSRRNSPRVFGDASRRENRR